MSTVPPVEHSYVGPAFKDAKVHDAMRVGVITCRPETKLADVARMMVGYDVHSVVVSEVQGQGGPWGIVTSLDLARAADDLALAGFEHGSPTCTSCQRAWRSRSGDRTRSSPPAA